MQKTETYTATKAEILEVPVIHMLSALVVGGVGELLSVLLLSPQPQREKARSTC